MAGYWKHNEIGGPVPPMDLREEGDELDQLNPFSQTKKKKKIR